ncbi:MAG: hypothetical protein HYV14_05455 [Elusimicrobia bacterium]|nr:hypothetical protein [Elusimicrobiota bacterium]
MAGLAAGCRVSRPHAAVLFGLEAEGSTHMLFASIMAAGSTGMFLRKLRYGWILAAFSGAWPGVLAAWRHWYWDLGMPSPGGSAQALVQALGWADASVAAAIAVVLLPCGAVGWIWKLKSGDLE